MSIKHKHDELIIEVGAYAPHSGGPPPQVDVVKRPSYGHYLEDFVPGTVFEHPRGFTFDRGTMLAYARTFMEANPLYLNEAYAKAVGYASLPAAPHMVMNVALSLGVQNDSEKASANLGYYDVRFLRPVYAGDTLRGSTRVVERKDRGVGKPGITTIETLAENQHGHVVIQYRRKVMVPRRGQDPIVEIPTIGIPTIGTPTIGTPSFGWKTTPKLHIPFVFEAPSFWTARDNGLDAFEAGQIWVHANGRTVTDEHVAWTYQLGNTHPLHFDRLYAQSQSGPLAGEPIVYGGLVFAWLCGLASRDVTENVVWDLGFHDGYHTQPTVAGDTLAALTRIVAVEPSQVEGLGVVTMQLVGVKNIRAGDALERFGADLFVQEDQKKALGMEKITAKVFEIERQVLVRRL